MRTKFYEKMLNSIDKVETVTLDEKNDKSEVIANIVDLIRKKGKCSVVWKKTKWVVTEQ